MNPDDVPYSVTFHDPEETIMDDRDNNTTERARASDRDLAQAAQRQATRVEDWATEQIAYMSARIDDLERANMLTSIAVICVALAIVFETMRKAKAPE